MTDDVGERVERKGGRRRGFGFDVSDPGSSHPPSLADRDRSQPFDLVLLLLDRAPLPRSPPLLPPLPHRPDPNSTIRLVPPLGTLAPPPLAPLPALLIPQRSLQLTLLVLPQYAPDTCPIIVVVHPRREGRERLLLPFASRGGVDERGAGRGDGDESRAGERVEFAQA